MKKLLFFIFIFFSYLSYGQTSLSFTPISSDSLAVSAGRGGQHWGTSNWDNVYVPKMPGNPRPQNFYTRFNWRDIESSTTQGSYDFSVFDAFVNMAIDSNAMFSFGVMIYCNGCGVFGEIPQNVQNSMTAEGKPGWSDGGFITPNYQSTSLMVRYSAMERALANHIATTSHNGHSYTSAFLGYDLRYYGNFGEGNGIATSSGCPSTAQVTDNYLMSMQDSVIAIFPNVQLSAPTSYTTPYGNNYGLSNGNVSLKAAWYLLTAHNNYGPIPWRRDNIGDDGYNALILGNTGSYNPGTGNVVFKPILQNAWKTGPIGGEPAIDYCGTSRCGSIYCDVAFEVDTFHFSYFGNANYPILVTANGTVNCSGNTPANTTHGGDSLKAHMIAASLACGYRLALTGGSMTTTLISNASFSVTMDWQNKGLAPVYENWNVMYELRNGSTVVWSDTSLFTPKLFLPRTTDSAVTDVFTLPTISSGTYSLYMVIRDPNNYKRPLQLAVTGRGADGAYLIRSGITVTTGSVFTVNAGLDQSLPFGTTSTNVIGTISDTTIGRTYTTTWSKISGPSAVITSPSSRQTSITSMTSGTYVFRMSVYDGVSTTITDDIQITIAGNTPPTAVITGASSITLPTTTTNLSGTSSTDADGTIVSYAWSTVSGPNTPTFTTPTASASNITGMIQGTYVFKLIVTDDLGATGSITKTVVVNPVAGTSVNIFTTQVPANPIQNDGTGGIELGVKFKASSNGLVTGIRFYKQTGNTGTHIGELYSFSGVKLAQATFSGETASGWQSVIFSSPVSITSGTTYIAAYFSPNGYYSFTDNGMVSDIVNGPLTGIANNSTASVNGIYKYTSIPSFPNLSYQATNYFADVIFTTNFPPTAVISGSGSITLPTNSVLLSGTSSSDPDGTIASFAWTTISGPNAPTIATPSGSTTNIVGLIAGTYIFQLQVTDNLGSTGTATKTVVVNPQQNIPPVAVISGLTNINLPATSVVLDGTGSSDQDGTIASYLWSIQSGPPGITFSSQTSSIITISTLTLGTYVIKLVVTDNAGGAGNTTHSITVNPALPPVKNYFIIKPGHKPFFR